MAGEFLGALTGGAIGSAVVRLVLDSNQYEAELAKSKGQTAAATQTMGKSYSKFGLLAGAALASAGYAAIRFGASAVTAASNQEEALNKVNVSFGDAADAVVEFSDTSAKSFGISKAAALDAAGGFGVMLQTAGLTSQEAAGMSVELTKLAADLASFNNIAIEGADGALAKLRSGLAGEAEPLRRLGVLLSAERVKAVAYAKGIAAVGSELTEAQKVQARYALILEDTKLAQGDFQATSDSLANSQRILAAEFADLQADLGQALLPVVKAAVAGLQDFVGVVGPLIPDIIKLTLVVAGLAVAIKALAAAAYLADVGMVGLKVRALELSSAFGGWLTKIGPLAAKAGPLYGIYFALKGMAGEIDAIRKGDLAGYLETALSGVDFVSGGGLMDPKVNQAIVDLGPAIRDVKTQLKEGAISANEAALAIVEVSRAAGITDISVSDLLPELREMEERYTEIRDLSPEVAQGAKDVADALMGVVPVIEHTRDKWDDARFAVRRFGGMTRETLAEYREGVISNIESTFGTLDSFDGKWRLSATRLETQTGRMREAWQGFNQDLQTLNQLDVGPNVRDFLLEQGPGAISAFVTANREGRTEIVENIRGINAAYQTSRERVNNLTNDTELLKGALDGLDGKNVAVTFDVGVNVTGADLSTAARGAIDEAIDSYFRTHVQRTGA